MQVVDLSVYLATSFLGVVEASPEPICRIFLWLGVRGARRPTRSPHLGQSSQQLYLSCEKLDRLALDLG